MTSQAPITPRDPRAHRASLGMVFLVVFIDLLGFAIVLPLLPRYAERFEAGSATIGLLFASFSVMQFLFAPVWGRVSDRVGRRPVLLAGLAGSVFCYALFGAATVAESLALLFVSRIGAGVCGGTIAAAQAYIADATGARDRAKGMALIGAAFGLGFTFGPILGSISLPRAAAPGQVEALNPLPGVLAAGLSLIAFILAWRKLPESLRERRPAARHPLLNVQGLREAFRTPSVGMLIILFFLSTYAFAQFEATLSRLTAQVFHLTDRSNFFVFTYLGLCLALIQALLVRRLAPRWGEARMIQAGAALTFVGLALIAVSAQSRSLALLIGMIPVTICGFSFITPSVQGLVSRRSNPARQGEILGVNQSAAAMARILGPFFGNVLFGADARLVYVVSAAIIVPVIVMGVLCTDSGQDWPARSGAFPLAPVLDDEAERA
ncbi:MAG: MFS transporter [Phycisphaerae bacterium]|jgi:MFS family permease